MKRIIWVLVGIVILAGLGYGYKMGSRTAPEYVQTPNSVNGASAEAIKEMADYAYTENYNNEKYGFSFKYPAGFQVIDTETGDMDLILVENTEKQIGLQIAISAYDSSDTDITEELIRQNIPDMKITEPQELFIGSGGSAGKGLAFVSDNAEFNGKSREVWFVYNGSFYQISTFYEFDPLLKGLFGTWKFE